nr:MAG TPA: holin [Caudoviricetes sp.]
MIKKECLKRAVRTFGQAFAGVIVADVAAGVDLTNVKGVIQLVIIPAVAAGISAVMNMQRKTANEEE